MDVDPEFQGVGQEPGLLVWRIEKLKVVMQEQGSYGEFFTGDSYIILNTKKVPNANRLEWDVHFWLGKETSQDEQGVAAYKTVELDDSLGGAPVQHREVQDHESNLFLSYFKKGVTYREGGVASGFKKVERGKYEKRLLHVKGKRNVRVRQVELHCSSLNQGDVFIMDDGPAIYVWTGPNSGRMERVKGAEVARRIRDEERGGKALIHIIDDLWDSDERFYEALGSQSTIKPEDDGGDDSEFERKSIEDIKLHRVTDESGELDVSEIEERPLTNQHLESNDCFILDSGPSGIFAWIGKKCTQAEKTSAWKNATDFLYLRGYPTWTKVTRIVDGGETPLFKQYFSSWKHSNESCVGDFGTSGASDEPKPPETFNATLMHSMTVMEQDGIADDGSGSVKIWRIENREMVAVPEETYGTFYSGDCYVIQYTYIIRNKEHYIVYFWQGGNSSIDERGASAIFAQQLDDEQLGGMAVQIRVVQGKEPEHFLRLFTGRLIILLGGINNEVEDVNPDVKLFHIKGTTEFNTKTIQVPGKTSYLNSNDVFLLQTQNDNILWYGKGCSENEREVSHTAVTMLSSDRDPPTVEEGEEEDAFWDLLGGQEHYTTTRRLESDDKYVPPRLFQCSNKSGRFMVDEIVNFSQEDLDENDVMILDTYETVFVWVGVGANAIEKRQSLTTAVDYIKTDPSGRTEDNTLIIQIKQGHEPLYFTGYFHAWDPDRIFCSDKYDQMKLLLEAENSEADVDVDVADVDVDVDEAPSAATYEDMKEAVTNENEGITLVKDELERYEKTYTYKELKRKPPPTGVDPGKKEAYLSDADFKDVFGIPRDKYLAMKRWQQVDLKKKAALF